MSRQFSVHAADAVWPLLALAAVALSRDTNIDWQTSLHYFDAASQRFPARDAWVWVVVGHHVAKWLSVLAWLTLAGLAWHAWRERNPGRFVPCLFVLLTSLVAVSINGILKTHSLHSCPWSLQGLGGTAEYFRLLAPQPAHAGSGGCMPSGQAGVGFMWLALIPAARRWRPQWLARAAWTSILFGLVCGYVQVVRGAHFPSHVLMAAAVCGSVAVLSQYLPLWAWLERRLAATALSPHTITRPAAS